MDTDAAKKEAEEERKWLEKAKMLNPPPFEKPQFSGGTEAEYKEYMKKKYEYEQWENSCILLARKLRKENPTELNSPNVASTTASVGTKQQEITRNFMDRYAINLNEERNVAQQ